MPYEQFEINNKYPVVDLRSDTISKPTLDMRNAMRNAEVGDDVYNEDPTVQILEAQSAQLLGKESALFVPTGTMANLIATLVHCSQRGSELICGDSAHVFRFEQGGSAFLAGVHSVIIKNNPDGTMDLDEIKEKIRINPDVHEPYSTLILVENTHAMCGGKILPLDWLEKLSLLAKQHNIFIHMDGARLFNASVGSKVNPKEIVKYCDSVCFCLSKGLGCPAGALLCGTKEFVYKARRMRKALGGGMRQVGILAAAGLVALDTMIDRLSEDHKHAYEINKAISDFNGNYFKVNLDPAMTNILMVYLQTNKFTAKDVLNRLSTVKEDDDPKVCVKAVSRDPYVFRITLYYEITDEQTELAIRKLKLVMKEFENNY